MTIDIDTCEKYCSQLKSNHIYSTHYGRRFINHILQKFHPPCSYDGIPNIESFYFEIRPLVNVAIHLNYSHFVYFGHSYSFDGLIINTKKKHIRAVECTSAFDGENAELRNQSLIRYGRAPLNKPSTNQKSKKSGEREVYNTPSEEFYDSELVSNLKNDIQISLLKKLNKYDFKNGILVITFDELFPHLNPALQDELAEMLIQNELKIKESEFSNIVVASTRSFFYFG